MREVSVWHFPAAVVVPREAVVAKPPGQPLQEGQYAAVDDEPQRVHVVDKDDADRHPDLARCQVVATQAEGVM